jgi:hypothetical protein
MADIFLSLEEDQPLGIFIGSTEGCEHVALDTFMANSLIGLSDDMCKRYAFAFEIMAKQLRET